jgi:maleate isomerase
MNVYTSRFPVLPGKTLKERLEAYNDELPAVLGGYGRLRLDAAVVACTGSHYLLEPERDREFCAELSDQMQAPVQSATLAILAACEATGTDRITLVSPYEPWLTDISHGYWEKAGMKIEREIRIKAGERFSPYDVATDELVRQVRDARPRDDEALLFTGTGMFTFEALEELGRGNDRLLLTSNLCMAWWARHTLGATAAGDGTHDLMRRLSAQVKTA